VYIYIILVVITNSALLLMTRVHTSNKIWQS